MRRGQIFKRSDGVEFIIVKVGEDLFLRELVKQNAEKLSKGIDENLTKSVQEKGKKSRDIKSTFRRS